MFFFLFFILPFCNWYFSADFSFGPEASSLGTAETDGAQIRPQTAEEQELASLTTLHIDSETSSLSQQALSADAVTITGKDNTNLF